MLTFRPRYFLLFILIFLIEILIASFVNDEFIRPTLGDFLVVILIYCFVRSFFNLSVLTSAIFVLIFSFVVESLQYFRIVDLLGLQNSKIARIVIGTVFSWLDILAYTLGICFVLIVESKTSSKIHVIK